MSNYIEGQGVISSWLPWYPSKKIAGVICGVYRNGFYMLLTATDRLVYCCADTNHYLSVNGLQVDQVTWCKLQSVVAVNQLVQIEGRWLKVYTQSGILTVRFRQWIVRALQVEVSVGLQSLNRLKEQLELAWLLQRCGLKETKQLLDLVGSYPDPIPSCPEWRWIVGRGEGLTPAGDDVLFGYLVAKVYTEQSSKLVQPWLEVIKQQTTMVSNQFFQALADGYVSQHIKTLFTTKNDKDAQAVLEYLYHYGHTSGYDLLLGISLYLNGGKAQ